MAPLRNWSIVQILVPLFLDVLSGYGYFFISKKISFLLQQKCFCGSANCREYMGGKSQSLATLTKSSKKKGKSNMPKFVSILQSFLQYIIFNIQNIPNQSFQKVVSCHDCKQKNLFLFSVWHILSCFAKNFGKVIGELFIGSLIINDYIENSWLLISRIPKTLL